MSDYDALAEALEAKPTFELSMRAASALRALAKERDNLAKELDELKTENVVLRDAADVKSTTYLIRNSFYSQDIIDGFQSLLDQVPPVWSPGSYDRWRIGRDSFLATWRGAK